MLRLNLFSKWLCAFAVVLMMQQSAAAQSSCQIQLGIGRFARPNINYEIIEPTVKTLEKVFGSDNVCVTEFATKDLEVAVQEQKLDFFISSSGQYRRLLSYGVRDAAAVTGAHIDNPNCAEGTVFLANADRFRGDGLAQFQGGVLAANIPYGFTGYQTGIYELQKQGFDPKTFFKRTVFVGGDQSKVLNMLLSGTADLGFVRTCIYEENVKNNPAFVGRFRVIAPKKHQGFKCAHSTDLYPSWIFGVTKRVRPEEAARVTSALLKMSPTPSGLMWGIATDFSKVDKLLVDMQLGPYQFLRQWSMQNFFRQYKTQVAFIFVVILGLLAHAWRSDRLVKRKASELEQAHALENSLREETERAREHVANLQKAELLGQLSSILVHELGQPNAATLLCVHALRRQMEIGDPTREKVEKILNRIQSHAEREQQLIEKIRQYARRDRQTAEKIDAVRVVKEIVHKTALTFPQKMLVKVHCLSEHVFVQMDIFELEIVVINLLKNAYQAVAAQQNRKIDLTVVENKNFLEVSISDNGPYIDDEKLARMERPFQSSKPDGFGLGLHICRMIALRYGGKLQIERLSQEGGIVITVSFLKECR